MNPLGINLREVLAECRGLLDRLDTLIELMHKQNELLVLLTESNGRLVQGASEACVWCGHE